MQGMAACSCSRAKVLTGRLAERNDVGGHISCRSFAGATRRTGIWASWACAGVAALRPALIAAHIACTPGCWQLGAVHLCLLPVKAYELRDACCCQATRRCPAECPTAQGACRPAALRRFASCRTPAGCLTALRLRRARAPLTTWSCASSAQACCLVLVCRLCIQTFYIAPATSIRWSASSMLF
jgi:hypothetical protein